MSDRRYQIEPPKSALRFLAWFCPASLYEGIEGDLLEQFQTNVKSKKLWMAKAIFYWHVITFFRLEIILRNRFSPQLNPTIMLNNYVKVATRNLMKRKLFSFINAFGLSVGIAFCTLIYLYIQDERSFDTFHENKQFLYRVDGRKYDTWQMNPGKPYETDPWLQAGLRDALKQEIPAVVYATRFNPDNSGIFRYNDKVFTEKITYVDGDFFKMFSFGLLAGNRDKLFSSPSEIVLTPAIVKKYFGDEDPLGKTVVVDNEGEKVFTVTGIVESPPANSSLEFAILLPQENRPYYGNSINNWGNFNTPTFVQLAPATNLHSLSYAFDKLVQKTIGEKLENWRKRAVPPIPDTVKMFELQLTALPDIHLKKEVHWTKVSDPQYSYILGGIAILILSLACINYISLALTTSAGRKTEVGIRKVVGAHSGQLIYQFGLESLLLALLSMLIAVGLVLLFLPFFNQFTGKDIQLQGVNLAELAVVCLIITFCVGLLAGSYPSFFLSRFKPVSILRGRFTSRLQTGFTKPLVVLQFALASFLMISSVIMYRQMKFVAEKDLGFNRDQVLVIPTQTGWNKKADETVARMRARLLQEPNVIAVAGTTASFNRGYSRYGFAVNDEQKSAYVFGVDPEYISTLQLQLVEGRNFDPRIVSDSNAVIVNEALVRDMKWKNPLNEYLNWRQDTVGLGDKVIGVVKDYHFLSLQSDFQPMFLSMNKKDVGFLVTMLVKVKAGQVSSTIDAVRQAWKEVAPDRPFDYSFLDEDVARQYESQQRWMSIMAMATAFALLISSLGLFGLAGVNAINKTKEIGIRKVMGAELPHIFMLLNRQYFVLAVLAFAIAAPLSWYLMQKWLADFKFAIQLDWTLFALSLLFGLAVATFTVSYHAIKAALINPAETLKHE